MCGYFHWSDMECQWKDKEVEDGIDQTVACFYFVWSLVAIQHATHLKTTIISHHETFRTNKKYHEKRKKKKC